MGADHSLVNYVIIIIITCYRNLSHPFLIALEPALTLTMHNLLSLPEMVGAILTANTVDHALLYRCLQVNRLFSHETTRILWNRCKTELQYYEKRNKIPQVHDLASIASRDLKRAQYYATFIRELSFVRNSEDWENTEGEQ